MKILTWNLERLKRNKNAEIVAIINSIGADIIILTETGSAINFANYYSVLSTDLPSVFDGIKYNQGEKRTAIFSKYPIKSTLTTFDNYTAAACVIDSPLGNITLYGSIIGVFGGKGKRFVTDWQGTKNDIELIAGPLLWAGDFNITTAGYTYPSKQARIDFENLLLNQSLVNLTTDVPNHVCHIVLSNILVGRKNVSVNLLNESKTLSDHMGIWVVI